MDSQALRLLLFPKNRRLLGYLGWMLQNGGLSLIASEPEAPSKIVPESEPHTIKAPESMHADQSILESEVDLHLIDLWSADLVPTQVPTLESSSPVPS